MTDTANAPRRAAPAHAPPEWRCLSDRSAGTDRCQEWTDPKELETLAQELVVAKRPIAELEAGHAPSCPVAGVAERVSATWTITCAECGDVLHEETIEGEWLDGEWPDADAGGPADHHPPTWEDLTGRELGLGTLTATIDRLPRTGRAPFCANEAWFGPRQRGGGYLGWV